MGDFNGDDVLDLVVADGPGTTFERSNSVGVLLGNGDGTFGPARHFEAGSNPSSVTVADFNGDKIADLAVASWGTAGAIILLGKGDGTFQSARDFKVGRGPRSVVVGDFDGDGRPDLAVANWDNWGCRLRYWNTISGFCGYGTTVSVLLNETSGPASDPPSRPR